MTSQPAVAHGLGPRSWRVGYLTWAALVGALAIALGLAARLALPDNLGAYAVPGVIAALMALSFLVRPMETLLVFAGYVLLNETTSVYLGDASKRVDELIIPWFFLVTFVRTRPWEGGRLLTWREAALGVAIGLGILSSLVNAVPFTVWAPALILLVKGVAVYYLVSWLPYTLEDVRRYAIAFLAVAALLVVLGLIELINPQAFQQALGMPAYIRARGGIPSVKSLFFHPVLFGWFCTFAALYLFAAYQVYRRWWMLLAGTILTLGTILSGRRKPLVGMLVAVAGGVLWSFRRGLALPSVIRGWLPVAVAGLFLVVVFLPMFTSLYGVTVTRYLSSEPPGTGSGAGAGAGGAGAGTFTPARIALYTGSLEVGRDEFPLGAGLGRYGSWMSRIEYSPLYEQYGLSTVFGLRERNPKAVTDTFWPMILAELGALGLVAYAAWLAGVCWRVWQSSRRLGPRLLTAFRLGTLLVMLEALVESLAAPNLIAPPVAYFFFGAAAMVLALDRLPEPSADELAAEDLPAPRPSAATA
jgi:hypothetical protein